MLFLEIAAQGVKGVSPAGGRIALRPGYNVVAVDGPPLRRLVEALLYPGPRDGDAMAPGAAGGTVRAGITLVGDDQVTYRLVRDFAAGCQLHRFDAQRRAFTLVSQKLDEIAGVLQGSAGVPARNRFAALLTIAAGELPSRNSAPGLGASALAAAAPRRPAHPGRVQKRLVELRQELERARAAEKHQYRFDGLQSKLFKIEEALREGARIRDGLATAEAAFAEVQRLEPVAARLGDFEAKVAGFTKATGRRDEALARAAAERQAIDEVEGAGPLQPFWVQPSFMVAAGVGLLLFLAGALGAVRGDSFRYLGLLDIPAFGAAAWVALRHVETLEERSRVGRRRKVVEEREKKATDQWERETADLRGALQELGLPGVNELREALGKLAGSQSALEEWRQRLAVWEGQAETRNAQEEKQRIEAELREVESELAGTAGGYVRDPRGIEAEIARLEADAATPAPPEDPVAGTPIPAAAPAAPHVEPLRGLLERAGAGLARSPSAVGRALAARASQMLSAISGQRYSAIAVDDRGNLMAARGNSPQPAIGLPPADRDLCFLALRMALLEQSLAGGRAVAFADDALAALTESARRLAARILKQAARPGQLIHATRDPCFREAADHAV